MNKYRTDADYAATFENARKLRRTGLIKNVYETGHGHIVFHFRNSGLRVQLSNNHKLLIYWHSLEEKEQFYPLLKQVLVTADSSAVTIKPLTSTVYNIPYGTKFFTLAWCQDRISYVTFNQLLKAFFFGVISVVLLLYGINDILWFLSLCISLFFVFLLTEALWEHPIWKYIGRSQSGKERS